MCQSNKPVCLIVEDRPEVSCIWKRQLDELMDMEIRIAANLSDAKKLSHKIPPPDLLLLDLRLPDAHDEETLRAIKELTEGNPECAVLVLSGFVNDKITALAIEQGAHQVMEKMNIQRAADLWQSIKTCINKTSDKNRQRSIMSKLIEKLSALPLF